MTWFWTWRLRLLELQKEELPCTISVFVLIGMMWFWIWEVKTICTAGRGLAVNTSQFARACGLRGPDCHSGYFIYLFVLLSIFCKKELEMNHKADWSSCLREICASALINNPMKIGGSDLMVELDENVSWQKSNSHRIIPQKTVLLQNKALLPL